MKANEAPEKVYLTVTENGHYYTKGKPFERECTEYIRKDIFTEKICDWLLNNHRNYSTNALGAEYLIEDIKNYIKGE